MTQLIQYFKDNQPLITVTAVILVVAAVGIFGIFLARKYILRKRAHKEELEKATEALSNLPHTESQNALFLDPALNEETKKENEEALKLMEDTPSDEPSDAEEPVAMEKTAAEKEPASMEEAETTASEDSVIINAPIDDEPEQTEKENAAEEVQDVKKDSAEKPKEKAESTEKSVYKPVNEQFSKESGQKNESEKTESKPVKTEKVAEKKTEPIKKTEKFYPKRSEAQNSKPQKYAGKWLIYTENGKYAANLVASNGEVLLRTESYTALSGIKSGIETVKNNIAKNNFAISVDKNGNFFFKLYSSSTRLLCISEGYSTKAVCENAIESVKRFSKTAVLEVKKDND